MILEIVFSYDDWAEGKPSNEGSCMGYSAAHDLFWEDFACEGYIEADWHVAYLCEQQAASTTNGQKNENKVVR